MHEAIIEGTLLVDTAGSQVGQVNGLSIDPARGWSFGRPSRITARVRLGRGEVVDIDREVELGGPIHSKGVLIAAGEPPSVWTIRDLSVGLPYVAAIAAPGADWQPLCWSYAMREDAAMSY